MGLLSQEELHLQLLINNLRYNLLQFNHRMMHTIMHESTQLNFSAKSQLMSGVGNVSLKIVELQKAWDNLDYGWKSAGVLCPEHFFVFFPRDKKKKKKTKTQTQTKDWKNPNANNAKPSQPKFPPRRNPSWAPSPVTHHHCLPRILFLRHNFPPHRRLKERQKSDTNVPVCHEQQQTRTKYFLLKENKQMCL